MRVGISVFFGNDDPSPAEVGRVAEDVGFESIWVPEHSHIPLIDGERAGNLGTEYEAVFDPFVVLSSIAAVTHRIRLGTAVTLLPIRDPLWLAKSIGTLDQLSGGRTELGVGYGWLEREIAEHGVDFSTRRARAREYLDALHEMWSGKEPFTYDGEFLQIGPTRILPQPVQRPHPPIHIGAGLGPRTLRDIEDYADGWIPLGRFMPDPQQIQTVRTIRDDRRTLVTLYAEYRNPDQVDELRLMDPDRVVLRMKAEGRDLLSMIRSVGKDLALSGS